ncbi:hypothetical protein E8E13_000239 [Curvularia kusanoi]|uniref:Heterokaryon incompatibility domain-containing protein n=1 Tax=Curvularia kusanoi TaxID=90978 RepID=A0A9P4T6Y2_CURKU|nr:hypothetical protein E8E13_000239 [Curvularia kusanoi]
MATPFNATNQVYVYRPLETPHSIRVLRLYPGTGDEPLRGELLHTELIEKEISLEERKRFEPRLASLTDEDMKDIEEHSKKSWSDAEGHEYKHPWEAQDLASCLKAYDEDLTHLDREKTYTAFLDRNSIQERAPMEYGKLKDQPWQARSWLPFEALSYVWGSPKFDWEIKTPGGLVRITFSLFTALQQLRHPNLCRNIWADAICINQHDLQERSHQVKAMSRVYSHAEGVLIWLGPDPLKKAHEIFPSLERGFKDRSNFYHNNEKLIIEYAHEKWRSSWFSRLWVVQEFALGRKALFLWGDAQLEPFYLEWPTSILFIDQSWLQTVIMDPPILNVLRDTRDQSCSDKRDHVYGLLGLCKLSKDDELSFAIDEIVPDYSENSTAEDLFIEVACLAIEYCQVVELLDQAEPLQGHTSELPSWVPDWSLSIARREGLMIHNFNYDMAYSSSYAEVDRTSKALWITGIQLDNVRLVMSACLDPEDLPHSIATISQFWSQIENTGHLMNYHGLAMIRLVLQLPHAVRPGDDWSRFAGHLEGTEDGAESFITAASHIMNDHEVIAMVQFLLQSLDDIYSTHPEYFDNKPRSRRSQWKARKLFQTEYGELGIGPATLQPDDQLVLFHEGGKPFLAFVRENANGYIFVGLAYIPTLCEDKGVCGLHDTYGKPKDWYEGDNEDGYLYRLRNLWEARFEQAKDFEII